MSVIFVRNALSTDQDVIYTVFESSGRDKIDYEKYFSWKNSSKCEILLAENHEKILLGHAVILWCSRYSIHSANNTPEIMDVYTHPKFRRLGVATLLLRHSEKICRKNGIARLGLGVSLKNNYLCLHNLYTRLGYIPIGSENTPEGDVMVYEKGLFLE